MKKAGVFIVLLLLLASSSLVLGATYNSTDVDNAYDCLESKVGDCSGLPTPDMALSILSTPDNTVFDSCVSKLEAAKVGESWGNVKDTALALLALDHAGKDTESIESWLESAAKNSTDLTWYVQIDTSSANSTTCKIIYDNQSYENIQINEDKTLSSGAGSCLTRANNNYFLSLDPSCLEKKINVECEEDFIVALAYKYSGQSATLNLLDNTQSASAYGSVGFEVISKCFGEGSTCDFESSAWAAYALLRAGIDIEEYLPYLLATSEGNSKYLPEAFLYLLTKYDTYSADLIKERTSSGYWDISGSPYGRFYDSALAILALGANSADVVKALDWLYFTQDSEGCWQGSVRDTAMVLWASEQRAGRASGGSSQTRCEDVENEDYFCVPSGQCSGDELSNFFCSGSSICCTEDIELLSCSEQNGSVCSSGQTCAGSTSSSSDGLSCCLGECIDPVEQSACESAGNVCRTSCNSDENSVSLTCDDSGEVCCDYVGSSSSGDDYDEENEGSYWWIWLLIILILIALGVLVWVYKDKLFKKKDSNAGQKGQGGMPPRGPGIPPRNGPPGYNRQMATPPSRRPQGLPPKPGFPPVRR